MDLFIILNLYASGGLALRVNDIKINDTSMDLVIIFVIVIFSASVHEVCHALMARRFGDTTAEDEGRITLNPLSHIDPFGSILLPLVLWFAQQGVAHPIIFGSAKPVPIDLNRLYPKRLGTIMVSLAGPFSNLALAIVFALLLKLPYVINEISGPILVTAVLVNLSLFVFNLIPIPPLDGSKALAAFISEDAMNFVFRLEAYGFILIFIFLYTGLLERILNPILSFFLRIFQLS